MKYTVSRRPVLLAMIGVVVLDRSLVYPRHPRNPGVAYGSYDLNRGYMAFLFGCENVSLEYPTKTIFESLSLGVEDGDRIGIVGRNGDGKSSLLGLFEGRVMPDEGRVLRSRGVRFASLDQTDHLDDEHSVAWNVVGEIPEYQWASDARIRSILDGLIADIDWNASVGALSGGERRRVDLARVLIADVDVLLLDEPTNHLDIGAIAWLASFLKTRFRKRAGALVVVTHDRWFLDEVCLSMWEVHDKGVEPFEGGYSAYILQRVERDRLERLAHQKHQNLMRRELAWLSRGARARSTKPKFHVEAARELIAEEPPLRNTVELKRAAISRLGKRCVQVEDVTFSYDAHDNPPVIDDITWLIGPGDRFGLLGENGAGKSTLLDLVQGKLTPRSGRVKIGKTVKFAFLSQRLDELEELGSSLVREVLSRYRTRYVVDGKEVSPSQLLEQLGFDKNVLSAPVDTLSGGQKRRLQLMLILLDAPNVLILDEPSNDMDTDMLVAMETVLDTWPGTLILVSHDRYLMERVTDHQYALIDGKLTHVPRGVDEYLELLGESHRQENERNKAETVSPSKRAISNETAHNTLSGGAAHEARKQLRATERKIHTIEGKMEKAKAHQLEVDPSDYMELGRIQETIREWEDERDALEETWLTLSEQLEG